MTKLNQQKILWIIREIEKGRSMSTIARIQGITRARVWQIWNEYLSTGEIPELKKPGRKRKEISDEEKKLVLEKYDQYKLGPLALESRIERDTGIHIPHNRIYKIMLEGGLIMENPRKKRQRKYVRFERKHSMSLWQGDWKYLDNGTWLIAFLDDASRRIMCYGVFDNATTENTISVLKKGFEEYGRPREIMTDHGTQFVSSRTDKKGYSRHKFGEFLEENGIKHILARIHHPQTRAAVTALHPTCR